MNTRIYTAALSGAMARMSLHEQRIMCRYAYSLCVAQKRRREADFRKEPMPEAARLIPRTRELAEGATERERRMLCRMSRAILGARGEEVRS